MSLYGRRVNLKALLGKNYAIIVSVLLHPFVLFLRARTRIHQLPPIVAVLWLIIQMDLLVWPFGFNWGGNWIISSRGYMWPSWGKGELEKTQTRLRFVLFPLSSGGHTSPPAAHCMALPSGEVIKRRFSGPRTEDFDICPNSILHSFVLFSWSFLHSLVCSFSSFLLPIVLFSFFPFFSNVTHLVSFFLSSPFCRECLSLWPRGVVDPSATCSKESCNFPFVTMQRRTESTWSSWKRPTFQESLTFGAQVGHDWSDE